MFDGMSKRLLIIFKAKLRFMIGIALRVLLRMPFLYLPLRNLARFIAPKMYAKVYALMVAGPETRFRVTILGARATKIYLLQKHLSSQKRFK